MARTAHRRSWPAAADAGLDVLALTDHDTTSGWDEAAAVRPSGLTLVLGSELSCMVDVPRWAGGSACTCWPTGSTRPSRGWPPSACGCVRPGSTASTNGSRCLRDDGYDLSLEPLRRQAEQGTVGRPHLRQPAGRSRARAFVRGGVRPRVGGRALPGAASRLGRVRRGGEGCRGRWGHRVRAPVRAAARSRRGRARRSAGWPLRASPASRSTIPTTRPTTGRALRRLAAELDLVVTGSSDYHGVAQGTGAGCGDHRPRPARAPAGGTSPAGLPSPIHS